MKWTKYTEQFYGIDEIHGKIRLILKFICSTDEEIEGILEKAGSKGEVRHIRVLAL